MKVEDILKTDQSLPESKRLAINIMMVSHLLSERIAEALKPFEISAQQFNVLRILRGQKGKPANLSTIQERMIQKMSNTTRLVDKLITKNYCERIVCPSNRRKVEITITGDGLEILKKLDKEIDAVEKDFSKKLNEEEIEYLNNYLHEIRS